MVGSGHTKLAPFTLTPTGTKTWPLGSRILPSAPTVKPPEGGGGVGVGVAVGVAVGVVVGVVVGVGEGSTAGAAWSAWRVAWDPPQLLPLTHTAGSDDRLRLCDR